MPQIKNDTSTGLLIKKALEDNNISISELSGKLHMSKKTLTQALEGQTSLNTEVVEKISEILGLSIEKIVLQEKERTIETSYEKYWNDLDVLLNTNSKSDLAFPDMHGKYLVEYILDNDDIEGFQTLIKRCKESFDEMMKHQTLFERVIEYTALHCENDLIYFVQKYAEIHPGLYFSSKKIEELVFKKFDEMNNKKIFDFLLNYEIKINDKKIIYPLAKREILDVLSKYHLLNMTKYIYPILNDFEYTLKIFIKDGFLEGIKYIVDIFPRQDYLFNKMRHESYVEAVKAHNEDIIEYFEEKRFRFILQDLASSCIEYNFMEGFDHLYKNYRKQLYYRELICLAATKGNVEALKIIDKEVTQEDLNICFSLCQDDDFEFIRYIVSKGAILDNKYYNISYCKKMNNLLTLKKEEI